MQIRIATPTDFDQMWPLFQQVIAGADTYVFAPDTSREDAFAYWFAPGVRSYVALTAGSDERIVGMYKLVANQRDLGSHVANASFMVDAAQRGAGLGRLLGEHCLQQARALGFTAIQFNFVVSTNTRAIALWKKLGFSVIGTVPKAYQHREAGLVDALIMHRFLQ